MARGTGILGGSFNPVHVGHLRLAIELRERLQLERTELVPCAEPPHKPGAGLLPYALRLRLAELALSGSGGLAPVPGLAVSTVEERLPRPSYTHRTLAEYGRTQPAAELYFILGAGDLPDLPSWRRGLELAYQANLVVVPRAGAGIEQVAATVAALWGDQARPTAPANGADAAWRFTGPGGTTQLLYVDLPVLHVSASQVRAAWLAGRSVRFLVPEAVERALAEESQRIAAVWGAAPALTDGPKHGHGRKS